MGAPRTRKVGDGECARSQYATSVVAADDVAYDNTLGRRRRVTSDEHCRADHDRPRHRAAVGLHATTVRGRRRRGIVSGQT
jgi:hypothetical protein